VIHGEIPPEDAAALMESAEERALAQRLFAAPSDAHRAALLAALLDRIAEEDAGTVGGGAEDELRRRLQPTGQVVRPPRWRRRGVVLAMVAAAALLVPFLPPPDGTLSTTYTLDPLTGEADWRGASDTVALPSYSPASNLRLVLRPTDPVAGPVELVAFARSSEGQSLRLELQPRIAPNGLVSVDVPMRDTGLYEGEWELVLVVGRPGVLPSSWEELGPAERAAWVDESPAYVVLRTAIRVATAR
jgi:hypothetical protein